MKKRLLGYYDYTVVLTYCGMLSAMAGILRVLQDDFLGGMIFLMTAGVCDMFDGAVASTKDRSESEKCFGIQIDSLSDLISFGVLPGLFVCRMLDGCRGSGILAAGFVLCALIRLAYFNVLEADRQKQTTERRKSYLGIPVTTIALLLPAAYLLYDMDVFRTRAVFPILMILTAAGFLSNVEVPKPQKAGKLVMLGLGVAELIGLLLRIGARL